MEWSIIVFCYNEASSISLLVAEVIEVFGDISTGYEIIIVNDGSTDSTESICKGLCESHSLIKLINHSKNLGIGSALQTGYREARNKYICAVPGDGQFDIRLLKEIPAFDNKAFFSFYRLKTNYNWYRSMLTWGNKIFNRFLLCVNLRDVNWVKVYTREQLNIVSARLTSSLVETEICAKLIYLGVKPIELPSEYLARKGGTPKGGNLKTLVQVLKESIKLILEVLRFRKKSNASL